MSNLTTRKIVLGLLMALVLAFSVQGIAEAFTVTQSSTSDEFKLVKSVGTVSGSFSFNITFDQVSEVTGTGTSTLTVNEPTGVTVTSFTVTSSGTDTDASNTTVTGDPTSTSATGRVSYTLAAGASSLGLKTFSIAGNTVHTAYGVRDESWNSIYLLNNGTMSPVLNAARTTPSITVDTNASWTKVTFSTTSGLLYSSGANYLYVSGSKLTASLPSGSRSITAYSQIDGSLMVGVQYRATQDATATVTAQIPRSTHPDSTHKVTVFFDSSVRVERTSGNDQFGQVNSTTLAVANTQQLVHPLVVRVLDGTRGVGQKQGSVTFTADNGALRNGALRYFSASLFDNDATKFRTKY